MFNSSAPEISDRELDPDRDRILGRKVLDLDLYEDPDLDLVRERSPDHNRDLDPDRDRGTIWGESVPINSIPAVILPTLKRKS